MVSNGGRSGNVVILITTGTDREHKSHGTETFSLVSLLIELKTNANLLLLHFEISI